MANKKKKFNWRAWTTFFVIISFIVDTVSGIVLYIAPPGRIANWTNWTFWGIEKEEWGAIHTIFGYLLLIIVALHLYYNWKTFIYFLWDKIHKALNLRRELLAATLISLVVFLGSLWNIPPFSTIMNFGETVKNSWEESKIVAPIPHSELMSLQEFSSKLSIPLDETLNALKSKGYKVKNAQQSLEEIARESGTSPDKIYEAIKSSNLNPVVPETIKGTGLGKKTLEMIISEKGLSLDDVLSRLKKKGIDAKPKDKLKDIANKQEKTPMEIMNIIEGKQ